MYVSRTHRDVNGKRYEQILLRESYRDKDALRSQVKHRTLLNLTHRDPAEVASIEWALKNKNACSPDTKAEPDTAHFCQGPSVGALWLLYQIAERTGLSRALGNSLPGRRMLWLVMARLIEQGSRLSAVRLASEHAVRALLDLPLFDEETLYRDLDWLDARQQAIETALFQERVKGQPCQLFLYDVTSSYLEGEQNAYAKFGYNRDKKKGKRQIVVGLLADRWGLPVSVQVFSGNTQDPKTVKAQIEKLVERFGASEITLVGDRGMIKKLQIEALHAEGFHYLTAITKPQIEKLLKKNVLQLELFEENLCEMLCGGLRYLARRNPQRALEIAAQREDKWRSFVRYTGKCNAYLHNHPKAAAVKQFNAVTRYAKKLFIDSWTKITVRENGRYMTVTRDEAALEELRRLDGCYVLKTDVASECADAQTLHARYKDLGQVEFAFRSCKTGHLEMRPVFVRTAAHTRAYVFIVMLAYLLRCELAKAWADLDLTVEEGLHHLSTLCTIEMETKDGAIIHRVPEPRETLARLFAAAGVTPPEFLPRKHAKVATKQKLPKHRKIAQNK